MDLAQIRRTWEDEEPLYKRLMATSQKVMTRALKENGIFYDVQGRTKPTTSLLKKVIRKDCKYEDIIDKAGVRVVTKFLLELEQVDRIIKERFTVLDRDDKAEQLGATNVGYVSIHYKVRLNPACEIFDTDLNDHIFEIQLRTLCQHVWAEMAHDKSYKAITTPTNVQRRINALSALLEVADREFEEAYRMTISLPQSSEQLLHTLEPLFLPMALEPYDRALSLDVIKHLMPLLNKDQDIAGSLQTYAAQTRVQWRHIVMEYGPNVDDYLFVSQPEGLLIGYLLERDRYKLMDHWQLRFPLQLLSPFASLWGYPLPEDE